ncbi:MAG: type VI secretion system-associated protein VasI [Candidatus Pseudomonas phytovorans]|uniref:Type VI secretion system-associated protein VasI n=1 Tax=Candidatus Pseudomonas phytovorans TaxID=3121377 RepID=A0AAJ5WC25_9PSED|nr:type VI secretion system-associated protein VasI [Pseudomonas sp.]WEK28030.1 MAG: type VI secretion system-associated protein VasI [Pseudomonas sp.]
MINRCVYGAGLSLLFCLQPVLAGPTRDCPRIVSSVERLACFDQAAGTPAYMTERQWSAPEQQAPSVLRVLANEAARAADDLTFRLRGQIQEGAGAPALVISAPAIASSDEPAYMAISCIQAISRLQLIARRPIEASWVKVRLTGQGWSTRETPWQVMENGQVLDAGRGLPAIEQIRELIGAQRIQVVSDHAEIDGLTFDAQGLDPLISQARSTCRW